METAKLQVEGVNEGKNSVVMITVSKMYRENEFQNLCLEFDNKLTKSIGAVQLMQLKFGQAGLIS